MDKESLKARIEALQAEQKQINAAAVQSTQQSQAIAGHLNEALYWLNVIIQKEKECAEQVDGA